jgi:curved DNA-binding protein CbpA
MTASAQDDFYKILGISRDATGDAIKHGYRRQALRWHPDKHCGANAERAAERFKKVSEAYKTLSDPQRRAAYDRPGSKATHSVNEEDARVIWTKTFGWPGANISFGWIGSTPGPPSGAPARPSQKDFGPQMPSRKHSQKRSPSQPPSPQDPQPPEEWKSSAFDLVRGVFGSMSSLSMDDGGSEVRQRNGEAAKQCERQADRQADRQAHRQAHRQSDRQSDRSDGGENVPSCRKGQRANSTASMLERDAKMEFIMAEYRAGDLSEEEMKNLLRQM